MENIFLSASIPAKDRDQRYYDTADFIAIREAVLAVATVVVPHYRLIWGGHPAITPLIRTVYQKYLEEEYGRTIASEMLGSEMKEHVLLYQSEFFAKKFPEDNNAFEQIKVIPEVDNDREESLRSMREEMIVKNDFLLAVFIGGMDGVEKEYKLFTESHPDRLALPLVSTGAAAAGLSIFPAWDETIETSDVFHRVKYDRAYISLLEDAIELAKRFKSKEKYKEDER